MTARELATALEVSQRTVYRDVEALCRAGVPVHMERGSLGGVVLADDYRRALASFSTDELRSLFSAGPGPLADLGIAAQPHALQKLAGALPALQRRALETSRDRLLVDHNRWSRARQPTDVLQRLRAAADENRRATIRYRDRGGVQTERDVEPLGLVAKAGVWYLIAREAEKGYRTFRAERIEGVAVRDERFDRPADFNLEDHWNASVISIERQSQETFDVVLRLDTSALPKVTSFWDCTIVAADGAETTLRIAFPSRDVAIVQTLVLGAALREIVSPADVTSSIVACARAALVRYDSSYGASAKSIVTPASAKPK